jgi:hypothetical protein
LDASVWINILATGFAKEILGSFEDPPIVVDVTANEVRRHPLEPATITQPLEQLIADGLMSRHVLDEAAYATFVSLVGAAPPDDLGDGEAATLSFAQQSERAAAIDERKARRIAAERFPEMEVVSTVSLLRSEAVGRALGDRLPDAVFSALSIARMRVLKIDAAWIVDCVGLERARSCRSVARWMLLAR